MTYTININWRWEFNMALRSEPRFFGFRENQDIYISYFYTNPDNLIIKQIPVQDFIGGGSFICISYAGSDEPANNGVIGGGCQNCIMGGYHSGILGGFNNYVNAAAYASIVGGCQNTVSAVYSSILGGKRNSVSGFYGSVLGGQGNNVLHNWASASGYNLTSVAPKTFHANCLNACDTPGPFSAVPSLPAGSLYYGTVLIPGAKLVYIV